MIRYSLVCEHEHEFDGWFSSSAAFNEQVAHGDVSCPQCMSTKVRKGLMAPSVRGTKKSKPRVVPDASKMVEMMTALRAHVESNFDHVGDQFAEVARRIHYEEETPRGIYGEVTADEARELIEEGVDVAPLPVLTGKQTN
ncbi:MAG: DUF1178 family protein [Pseudomonadota bacterium]